MGHLDMVNQMVVQLEAYEGPVDLLLQLIRKNEIDIYDIPMAQLTQQYLNTIHKSAASMENMSEFLVMAATLLEIKSRMLLPRILKSEEGEEEEDPREALVAQLIAYKQCQELAEILKQNENAGKSFFKKPEYPLMSKSVPINTMGDWLNEVSAGKLFKIFTEVMQKQALKVDVVRHNFGTVSREKHTISDLVVRITNVLNKKGRAKMSELFEECKSKRECLVAFLALLEMIRRRQATVVQLDLFAEIEVSPCQTG